ncbi:MAG: MFS transporter [Actinomycetales bacterium]|nr:MFS transporter [Actinomycetales bacterium]
MAREHGPSLAAGPWQSVHFRRLVTATTVSAFGNALSPVATAFAVLHLGGTATQLGLVVAAYAVAQVLTVLLGGVLGDRVPRAALLQGSSLASAVTQGVLAMGVLQGWASIPMLAAAGAVTGCLGALASPASQAVTRETVPEAMLQRAISWRRLGTNAASVAGFAAAGIIVAGVGAGWAIAADAVTFLVAAAYFASMRLPAPVARETQQSVLVQAREGAAEVFRHTWLWVLISQALVYHLFYASAQGVLGPIVVQDHYGAAAWGWALAVLMVGFMVGAAITLRWRPRRSLYAGTVLLLLTACFPAALAANVSLGLVLAGAFLHGLGLEIFSVNWDLAIQQNVAPDKLARVYGFDVLGSFLARPIGLALTGPVAEATGYATWLWVVTAVIVTTLLLVLCVPAVRHLERRDGLPLRTNDPIIIAPPG